MKLFRFPLFRLIVLTCMSFLFWACSESTAPASNTVELEALQTQDESLPVDTLSFAALNQTIGFNVTELLYADRNDTMEVFRRMEQLWEQYVSNKPLERLQIQADSLAFYNPDVIALQEVMVFYKDGEIHSDFIGDLPGLIQAAGGAEYVTHFQKMNELELKLQARVGDSLTDGTILTEDSLLDLRFYEGNALLIKKSLNVVDQGVDLFKSIIGVPFLEGEIFYSERGNVWAKVKKDGKTWEVGSNHLEISTLATQSKNQAAELLGHMDDRRDTEVVQVILGDLNYTPGNGTHEILTGSSAFADLLDVSNSEDSVSCCQELTSPVFTMTRFLDYALVRNATGGTVSYHGLGPVLQSDNSTLWGADHALLVGEVYAQ